MQVCQGTRGGEAATTPRQGIAARPGRGIEQQEIYFSRGQDLLFRGPEKNPDATKPNRPGRAKKPP